ncbi:MAG: C40 family peptidase [Lachnospiraceae bacterium]
MKKSGKAVILFLGLSGGGFIGVLLLLLLLVSAGDAAAPVEIPATREDAYPYQYIGTELGIAWDMSMLCDAIRASLEGKGIAAYNPLLTSLQFCTMTETLYVCQDVSGNNIMESSVSENEAVWVELADAEWDGTSNILSYMGITESDVTDDDVSGFIMDMYGVAAEKSETYTERCGYSVKYEVVLTENPEYMMVLTQYIGIPEGEAYTILQLHDSLYLYYLYDYYIDVSNIGVNLPEVVTGSVSRMDLARVAVSIINWPYQMGGKSPGMGPPSGALDCSGYVDWVYYQCFGTSITAGSNGVPEGISVAGTALIWYACTEIEEADLQVGDLGFVRDPASMAAGEVNHVGIYIGQINGCNAFIHCGGRAYGTPSRASGRVGISISEGSNIRNPVTERVFAPAMPSCTFSYFRRPQFEFVE